MRPIDIEMEYYCFLGDYNAMSIQPDYNLTLPAIYVTDEEKQVNSKYIQCVKRTFLAGSMPVGASVSYLMIAITSSCLQVAFAQLET